MSKGKKTFEYDTITCDICGLNDIESHITLDVCAICGKDICQDDSYVARPCKRIEEGTQPFHFCKNHIVLR